MILTAIIFALILMALGTFQAAYVVFFVRATKMSPPAKLEDDQCPKATIIICLRGIDPTLQKCLEAVTNQDYPDFEVRVVVDHIQDPSMDVVKNFAQRNPTRFFVETLKEHIPTCSLKCSSLIQATSNLSPDTKLIAVLDTDAQPEPNWLRILAGQLQPTWVGAVSGMRWYEPRNTQIGTWCRSIWNAAAIVQMYIYSIGWGGSLAIKVSALREAGLVEKWRHCFCEDTVLNTAFAEIGLKVHIHPHLVVSSCEPCGSVTFSNGFLGSC